LPLHVRKPKRGTGLFKNNTRAVTHGTIAHEAIHAANFLFGDRGIVLDADNDEAFAYFTEWIVDQVYTFARECKFKPISL
jgi:hypothetical protein